MLELKVGLKVQYPMNRITYNPSSMSRQLRGTPDEIRQVLEPLQISIAESGLRSPVLIDTKGNLVAGQRRFLAVVALGWGAIWCEVVDPKDTFTAMDLHD